MATATKRKGKADEYFSADAPDTRPNNPLARCTPRADRVVVRRDVSKDVSKGGILLPETAIQHKQMTGTVYAVGPKVEGLAVGDRVIITGYAGLDLVDPVGNRDEEFVLLKDEDVLAVLED